MPESIGKAHSSLAHSQCKPGGYDDLFSINVVSNALVGFLLHTHVRHQ